MPTFQLTDWTQPIHQSVMPLIAIRNGRDENVWGSAFIIGRGWAVTAFHVLKDLVEQYEGPQRSWRNVSIGFEILGYLSLDAGTRFLPLKVLRAWRAEPLDIAVLAVGVPSDWPNDHVWGVPALDLLPPPVGTPIAGFGFAAGRVTRDQEGSIPRLSIDPMTATGEVLEIHHKLRDSAASPSLVIEPTRALTAG